MKISGIIMEVNPLHNGHIYFLDEVKKQKNDVLIAIISTNLTQRGDVSVLDKRTKTSLLLNYGVDIVLELPSYFANQGGYYFAKYALLILKHFKITDLYFGSESYDLNKLLQIANTNFDNKNFKKGLLKTQLTHLKSNDILAVSYLKNLEGIIPHLIKRVTNQYNSSTLTGTISSATAIRDNITDPCIINTLPHDSFKAIKHFNEDLLLETFLLNLQYAYKNKINIFLSEDRQLINKIYKIYSKYDIKSLNQIIGLSKDKNNSKYKIRRIINNVILLQIKVDEEPYNKVLGFNKKGQTYLKNFTYITSLKEIDSEISNYEIRLSNLLYRSNIQPKNVDFLRPVIKGD